MEFQVKALSPETWPDFEALARLHNGVWGGCWCIWFHHCETVVRGSAEDNRLLKHSLVLQGKAHAALVYDNDRPVAWCQYGSPAELPHIYHKKIVEADGYQSPDYRITCFFVDKQYRRQGAARAALQGALDLIAKAGGGIVESYPQDTKGKNYRLRFSTTEPRPCLKPAVLRSSSKRAKTTSLCAGRLTAYRMFKSL